MARVDKGRMEEEIRVARDIQDQIELEKWLLQVSVGCCILLCIGIASISKNEATLLVTGPVGVLICWFVSKFAKHILTIIGYTLLFAFIAFLGLLAYVLITGQVKSDRTIEDIKAGISTLKSNE